MAKICYIIVYTKEYGRTEFTLNEWNQRFHSGGKWNTSAGDILIPTFHREDGPAIIEAGKEPVWWLNGYLQKDPCPIALELLLPTLTDAQKALLLTDPNPLVRALAKVN